MKLLLIDDNPAERTLTRKTLENQFPSAKIIEVSEQNLLEKLLAQANFDLIISEYRLRWTNGLKLFRQIHHRYDCIPFIMLTGFGNEEIAVAAIKSGIDDYLSKTHRQHLHDAIIRCLNKNLGGKVCHTENERTLLCEKWDLAISRLTSDFAYSMRIPTNGRPVFEWFTDPLKKFTHSNHPLYQHDLPIYPEDQNIVQRHFDKLLAGFENTAEYRVISNTGDIHFFSDHALPIRDWSQGKVVRIYGAIQDVTHQRLAEDKLHLMQHAIDSSNNGIIITGRKDQDYAIIYANQAFVDMTGYSMGELLGRNPRFLHRDDKQQAGIAVLRAALSDNHDAHAVIRNYRKDGSLFWNEVYISPVYGMEHNISHYIGIHNDVTRRVEMNKLIWNKEAKMRAIFNNVMDGIIITDNTAHIESINPSAETMFGYSRKELQGQSVEQLISSTENQRIKFKISQQSEPPAEAWGITKTGNVFPVKIGISKISLEYHTLLIFTIQNISESKQAENALRNLSSHLELAREEERTWIAREIHDELGSKLTALKMDLSWLTEKLTKQSLSYQIKTTTMHQHINEAINSVKKIATDLRPSILDHLGLSAAIEWQVDNFREQSGLACRLSLPNQAIKMEGQRATAVFRIVQESLTNISRHAHATRVNINLGFIDNKLSLSIEDNGNGMTTLQMHNPQKFGIQGMHERARHFGGTLTIDSAPGKGCTVKLTLPQHPMTH